MEKARVRNLRGALAMHHDIAMIAIKSRRRYCIIYTKIMPDRDEDDRSSSDYAILMPSASRAIREVQ